jgi:hypothetical protein
MANSDSLKKFPYLLFDRRRHNKDLAAIRESCGQVNEQLLELCCKLQKEFDPRDLEQVWNLVAELKTLKACEEKLEYLEELDQVVGLGRKR